MRNAIDVKATSSKPVGVVIPVQVSPPEASEFACSASCCCTALRPAPLRWTSLLKFHNSIQLSAYRCRRNFEWKRTRTFQERIYISFSRYLYFHHSDMFRYVGSREARARCSGWGRKSESANDRHDRHGTAPLTPYLKFDNF